MLQNIKIYIKIYTKTAPTYFGLRPSSGSLHMSLAKVTIIKSVKVRRYGLCGCTFTDLINLTLARLISKLLDDGRRPKHVGAVLM